MADEPKYHSGSDSAAVKRKYEDSAPRRASGFSDGPPPSDSVPSYNNVPPPMDEIQIAKQKAQEIAARLFSSAEAKRPKFENGGSGWDSNDNSGFSSGPNALPMPSSPCCVPGFFSASAPESTLSYVNVPSPLDKIQIAKREAQEIAACLFKTAQAKHPKFNNGGFFAASSPDSVLSYNCVPPSMDEIQIAKQKAQEFAARLFKTAEAKHPNFIDGGLFAASSLDSVPSYDCVPPPMDKIQIAYQKAKEIAARVFTASEAKHSEFNNGGFSAASPLDSGPPYNNLLPPMDEIQIAKHSKFDNCIADWVSPDTCDFSSSSTGSKLMSLL